jgi:glucose-1-phosphate adenylyltransferase
MDLSWGGATDRREDEMATVLNEPLSRHALAFVLAGGRGSRLLELTDRRAKPAVYFGGKSRIIDFSLSNAVNSGIRRIAVATQYKAHSLIRHLQMGWNFFRPERNESFDILPASQRISETNWYLGTADAVYQNIDIIEPHRARFVVLLAGDHIYKMDYELMLRQHVEQRADVTIGCLEMPRSNRCAALCHNDLAASNRDRRCEHRSGFADQAFGSIRQLAKIAELLFGAATDRISD